jgi:hypothetical protein
MHICRQLLHIAYLAGFLVDVHLFVLAIPHDWEATPIMADLERLTTILSMQVIG